GSSRFGLFRTDPEDHTGAGNLHQRTFSGGNEFRGGIGLTEVAHSPLVGNPGAAVKAKSDVPRPIPAVRSRRGNKRLVARLVLGKPLIRQRERFPWPAEVDDLHFMADLITGGFGGRPLPALEGEGRGGIRRRETEVAFQRSQCGPT